MKKYFFVLTLFLNLAYTYSQKITLQINTIRFDSIKSSVYDRMLKEINQEEKMDKSSQIIKDFESISAKNDFTTALTSIPVVKINISKQGSDNYILTCDNPLDIYSKPFPFTNKIYSHEITITHPYSMALLGSYSANFVASVLDVNKTYKPICFAYFLEKERYLNTFLILEKGKNDYVIVDRKLTLFLNIDDFIKTHYGGNIENLLWLIKTKKENNKKNICLYIINDSIITEQAVNINPKNIDNLDYLNLNDIKLKGNKNLWKYDLVLSLKLKPNIELLNVEQFYKKYHIKQKDKKLKICIDKTMNNETSNMWIDTSSIVSVKIITDVYSIDDVKTKIPEKYINIVTLFTKTN